MYFTYSAHVYLYYVVLCLIAGPRHSALANPIDSAAR